jgi:polar amino acid transport system permease protein
MAGQPPSPSQGPEPGPLLLTSRSPRLLGGVGGKARGVALSTMSTVVVLAALLAVFLLAPGSQNVRQLFLSPTDMWHALIGDPAKGYYSVGQALWLNIRMFVVAEAFILVFGMALALVRQSVGPVLLPLRIVATVYVDIFRGVPLILVIYALGFGLPALELTVVSTQSAAVYGVLALVLSYSAYVCEVYRAGLNAVHPSQVAAARAIGLRPAAALRYVILPQAIRNVIPPLLNDFISLQKDTALVSVLGAIEANRAAQIYSETTFNFSSYVVAGALFIILTIPIARFTDYLIARDRARRLAGGAR